MFKIGLIKRNCKITDLIKRSNKSNTELKIKAYGNKLFPQIFK